MSGNSKKFLPLIPPPPGDLKRLIELLEVRRQYSDRFNPDFIQRHLDEEPEKVFLALLKSFNIDIKAKYILKLKTEIEIDIVEHKEFFEALRPKDLAEKYGIDFKYDNLPSAKSASYPSGHTAQAYYVALHLSEKFPELTDRIFLVAKMIAESRIDRGVHFRSDNEGGMALAEKLFQRKG